LSKASRDGLYFIVLGCLVLVPLGAILEHISPFSMVDFKGLFYGTRCLLEHGDPYNGNDFLRVFQKEAGSESMKAISNDPRAAGLIYFPTVFSVIAPFAELNYGAAQLIWATLTIGGLIVASFVIWSIAAGYAPTISGFLIGFMLANSEVLAMTANPAGVAISLCVLAVCCFVYEKHIAVGVTFLAISLLVKPHDVCFVWLYFLLAGGNYRRWALQTLGLVVAVSLPIVIWVTIQCPHWTSELHASLVWTSARGAISDPGPASSGGHRLGMIVDLQSAISFIRDDPRFYNAVSYTVFGILLSIWVIITLRTRPSPAKAWLALAAVSTLGILPIYHRQLDTKLLLLTVPACAALLAEDGRIGRVALFLTTAAFLVTGDIPWAILFRMIETLHVPNTNLARQIEIGVQLCPIPLVLLAVGIFYLWIYVQRARTAKPFGLEQSVTVVERSVADL
jgi:hypothetical protein